MIRRSWARREHVISVFFDIEKAFVRTWRYGIMRDLYNMEMRGLLPRFIENFLEERKFRVTMNNVESASYLQENGIPQCSVLSVTLFVIKMDEVSTLIPRETGFHAFLYMDNLQISYAHSDMRKIREKLQEVIDRISKWEMRNGFSFSVSKKESGAL